MLFKILLRYMVSFGRVPHSWDRVFLKLCCILSMFEDPAPLEENGPLWRLSIFKWKILLKVTFVIQWEAEKTCLKLLASTLKWETFQLEPTQLAMDLRGNLVDIVQTLQQKSEKYQENGLGPKVYCQYTALSAKNRIKRQNLRQILELNKKCRRV